MKSLSESFEMVSEHVREKCGMLGANGIFVMCDLHAKKIRHVCIDVDVPMHNNMPEKKDLEYLGIAFAKIAFTGASLCSSCDEPNHVRAREVYWMSSAIESSGKFAYAFSGTAEKINEEMTKSALEFHAKL